MEPIYYTISSRTICGTDSISNKVEKWGRKWLATFGICNGLARSSQLFRTKREAIQAANPVASYSVAFVDGADGEWDRVHELGAYSAANIDAANEAAAAWVVAHHPGRINDWYLVCVDGENANG